MTRTRTRRLLRTILHRRRRHRDQPRPATNWRIETELIKFRAEISAWEAEQRTGQ